MARKMTPPFRTNPITREDAERFANKYVEVPIENPFWEAFNTEDFIKTTTGTDADFNQFVSPILDDLTARFQARLAEAIRPVVADIMLHEGNAVLGYSIPEDASSPQPSLQEALEVLTSDDARERSASDDTAIRLFRMFALVTAPAITKYLSFRWLSGDDAGFVLRREYAPFRTYGLGEGSTVWVRPSYTFSPGQVVLVTLGPDVLVPAILVSQSGKHSFAINANPKEKEAGVVEIDDEAAEIVGLVSGWEINADVVDADAGSEAGDAADRAAAAISETVAPARQPSRARSAGK
jgi:hypothetical protein